MRTHPNPYGRSHFLPTTSRGYFVMRALYFARRAVDREDRGRSPDLAECFSVDAMEIATRE
jgi:hypothetical protein